MKHVQDRIPAFLDGELTEAAATAVREHCRSCPECDRVLQETKDVWAAVATAPEPRLGQSTWPALARRLQARQPEPRQGRLPGRWPGGFRYTFAGLAMGAAAAGLVLGLWLGGSLPQTASDVAWNTLLEEGALLVEGGDWTLDQAYLAAGDEAEEDQP